MFTQTRARMPRPTPRTHTSAAHRLDAFSGLSVGSVVLFGLLAIAALIAWSIFAR